MLKHDNKLLAPLIEAQKYVAKKYRVTLISYPIQKEALYLLSQGAKPKPKEILMKTQRKGPAQGYILCDDPSLPGKIITNLRVLTTENMIPLTSDLDILKIIPHQNEEKLFSYNDPDFGMITEFEKKCLEDLNKKFEALFPSIIKCSQIVQHGPFERYLKICPNKIKYPIHAFNPKGQFQILNTKKDYLSFIRSLEECSIDVSL